MVVTTINLNIHFYFCIKVEEEGKKEEHPSKLTQEDAKKRVCQLVCFVDNLKGNQTLNKLLRLK